MKVVILAGGLGTRLSEETKTIPKPMIEIGGKPMLWHIMNWYASFGHKEFIICCGYKGETIKKYFWDMTMYRRDATFDGESAMITFLNEKTDLSDWKVTCVDTGENTMTGGRIARVAHLLGGEPFMLTYGDGVGNVDLDALLYRHKETKAGITITAVQHPARFGVLDIDRGGLVSSFAEKAGAHSYWINGGFSIVSGIQKEQLHLPDSTVWETDILPDLAKKGHLCAYKHTGFWKCMDTLKDKMEFEEMFQKKGNIYGN
jgi:glucose-1-phosphate cytidylyltransferase